jgi:hypothetical protein
MFSFVYTVSEGARLGAWTAHWEGIIEGNLVQDDDGFTVVSQAVLTPAGHSQTVCSVWATSDDLDLSYEDDFEAWDEALLVATEILYELSSRQYPGICTDTIRPQAVYRAVERWPYWWPAPSGAISTAPWGYCSCHRPRETGCARVPEIKLPGTKVNPDPTSIIVKIDGNVLDPDQYRVDDHRYLVRTDGHGWPCCQRMTLDDSEPGTFSITYEYGRAPTASAIRACKTLAAQFMKAWSGDKTCELPQRVQTITRQGVTAAVVDPFTLFDKGKTGINSIDMWLGGLKTGNSSRRATAIIPGRWRSARRANQ